MAVILPSTYTDGTAVCTNGTPNVVGTGTMWLNTILPGDFFWSPSGESVRVLNIVDDTHITLAYNWPGATQATGPYEIRFQADQGRVQETTRQLLERMQSGNLYAFADLDGMTDLVPYFTGPGTMGLLSKQDLINGVNYDVQVATLADRAPYDTQVKGFTVLVSDNGDGRAAVYSKNSNSSGDWSTPAYLTGPAGLNWRGVWSNATAYAIDDAVSYNNASFIALAANTNVTPVAGATWGLLAARGATGATGINPRGTYNGATAYAISDSVLYNGSTFIATAATTGNAPPNLPTTSNAWWQLIAQKGTDGTGTGDVVGPAGAVADRIATFDGTTGKLIKDSGKLVTDAVFTSTGTVTNLNLVAFDGTTGRLVTQRTNTQVKTWLATAATDVSFNNATAALPGAPATVQAAIDSLASNSGGKQDAIFALEIADLKGVRMGMNGGIADSFDDTTGIVTSGIGGIDGYVTTILHLDGTNGSTTITDSSFAVKTWTPVGDAKISTAQSKFGGASLILDGAGDHLTRAYDADFDFAADFTVDCWFRTTVDSKMLYMKGGGTGGIMISVGTTTLATGVTANKVGVWLSGGVTVSGTTTITDGNWHHVAVTRSGTTVRVFVDGALEGTGTHSAALTANIAAYIGSDGTGNYFNGYVDELRITKGVARWTAAFTPPSGAYTVVGGVDANASTMLHFDGTNGSTTITNDGAVTSPTWSISGAPTLDTSVTKFGASSLKFTGSGYLAGNTNPAIAFGTGDFTIELWIRFGSVASTTFILDGRSVSGSDHLTLLLASSKININNAAGSTAIVGTTTPVINTWYHIAVVRASGVMKLYFNGVQEGSNYTDSFSYGSPAAAPKVGTARDGSSGPLTGNIDELRISNTARYLTNFTPYNVAFFADVSGSANYVYDAANDYFYPSLNAGTTVATASNTGASVWPTAGYTIIDRSFAVTNSLTVQKIGLYTTAAATGKLKILNETSTTTYDVLVDLPISHPGTGWVDFDIPLGYNVPASGTIRLAAYLSAIPAGSTAPSQLRSIKNADATGAGQTGFSADTGGIYPLRYVYGATPNNMTLLSVTYPAATVPGTARIALQLAGTVAFTPNTDFTMEVSRDGGTTWTTAVLVLTVNYGGVMMYEATVSLSGQPSGSNMVWRMKSLTNKNVIASGVVLQQS